MSAALNRILALWMLLGLGLLCAVPAKAQNFIVTCSTTSISNLAFGTVDPQSSLTNTTATINFSCNNPNHQFYSGVLCFAINDSLTNRQMLSGVNTLNFGIYTDAGHSAYWGANANALIVPVQIPNDSPNWTSSATLYGQVAAGQTGAVNGSYSLPFTPGQTTMAVNVSKNFVPTDCVGAIPVGTGQSFLATATVAVTCTVSATTLDFGAPAGFLTSNVDAASTITTTCVSGTPYQIGLNNGANASGATRRMAGGAEFISYELYRDSGRSQRWGNTINTDTVTSTGTGLAQSTTVYGRVAPQTTPSPNTYSDTITVTVTY